MKSAIIIALIVCVSLFQNSFAQLSDEFEPNTIDTVSVSDTLPVLIVGAIIFAFVLYRKKKTVN